MITSIMNLYNWKLISLINKSSWLEALSKKKKNNNNFILTQQFAYNVPVHIEHKASKIANVRYFIYPKSCCATVINCISFWNFDQVIFPPQ